MIKLNKRLPVGGTGLWSRRKCSVTVTGIEFIDYGDNGLINVYFDTNDWDVDVDGLIYTDPLFLHELKHMLVGQLGLSSDVGYSEQGMQGDNYVNLDAGVDFARSWHRVVLVQQG